MSDPLAASVSVLCHFDGAYGTTTYTNEVPDGPALASTSGLARLVTASEGIAPLFGSACLLSPEPTSPPIGNGVWISSIPASGLGTAWCVEIAFYEESIDEPADPLVIPPGVSLFTTYGGESSNLSLDYYDSGTGPLLRLFYWDGATYQTLASSSSLTAETWHQVCADYDGTTIRLFADGVLVDSASLSSADFDDNNGWLVQGSIMGGDRFLIDELRITHASRRTANYTPETSEFTWGNVVDGDGGATIAASAAAVGRAAPYFEVAVVASAAAAGSATAVATASASLPVTAAAIGKGIPYGEAAVIVAAAGVGTRVVPAEATAAIALTAAATGWSLRSLPIQINRILVASIGIPIKIGLESAVSAITLPISLGTYAKTVTLPIRITTPVAVSDITLPIRIYGDLSGLIEAGTVAWSAAVWRPKITIGGTDISAKLVGAIEIETEEMASPVASFAFLPAAGALDPLGYVGATVVISWDRYVAGALAESALRFTGLVSDPTWDADQRVLSISATGDLQARLDRMSKAEIDTVLAPVSPSFSKHIFGPPEDMSGWEYSEALISTTDGVLWMDVAGTIRATSTLPAVSADYTFEEWSILTGSLAGSPEWPNRQEMVNKIELSVGYRHKRKRQRHVSVKFWDIDLENPSTYLSGLYGGWELPQKSQVESAANGGGWTVIGEITFDEVWPSRTYPTYSDTGVAMTIGWANNPTVTADLCTGATWTAARRWMQTVTETATITVNATESQEVIGILADNEKYGFEDPTDDETWETDLEYTDFATGATLMGNGVDKKIELDDARDEFEAAQTVAIAKARGDILRGHRGTTVTFQTPFAPSVGLEATVEIDTTYLQCTGRVRRIVDTWNIDSGECLSTISLALYRHNGSGLTSDTEIAPVEEAADPDETKPETRITMGLYIGGQDDRPKWSTVEAESGYFVNLPFDPAYGSATLRGGWSRNPENPQVAPRIYEEGMRIKYPDIDESYADPQNAAATATIEVAIPEDPLVIVSG